jgi:hypothetical protein
MGENWVVNGKWFNGQLCRMNSIFAARIALVQLKTATMPHHELRFAKLAAAKPVL